MKEKVVWSRKEKLAAVFACIGSILVMIPALRAWFGLLDAIAEAAIPSVGVVGWNVFSGVNLGIMASLLIFIFWKARSRRQ